MVTKLTNYRYGKIFKTALVLLLVFISFINAQRAILLLKAGFLYDIPNVTSFEYSTGFKEKFCSDISKISYFAQYGGGEVTKDSLPYIKAHDAALAAYNDSKNELLTIFDDYLWLKEHQPTLFYIEEYNAYYSLEEYNRYLDGNEPTIHPATQAPAIENTTYNTDETETYNPNGEAETQTQGETTNIEMTSVHSSLNSGATPEERYPNWQYNNAHKEYYVSVYDLYTAKISDIKIYNPDLVSREQIIAYYDKQIANIDKNDAFWQNYRLEAERAIEEVGKFVNLKFAVLDKITGAFYSNFAAADATGDSVREEIKAHSWYMMYSSETGLEMASSDHLNSFYYQYYPGFDGYFTIGESLNMLFGENDFSLYIFLPNELASGDDYESLYAEYENLAVDFNDRVISCLVGLALMLAIIVYLVILSGRNTDGELIKSQIDRLYHDLHIAISLTLSGGLIVGTSVLMIEYYANYLHLNDFFLSETQVMRISSLMFALGVAVLTEMLVSIGRNVKNRNFIKHTLLYKFLILPRRCLRKLISLCRKAKIFPRGRLKNLKQQYIYATIGFILINFFLFFLLFGSIVDYIEGLAFLTLIAILIFNGLVFFKLIKFIKSLDKIMDSARSIRQGELDTHLNIMEISSVLQPFANDVIENQEGLRNAVSNAIREERTKAELITNVSHDLKTPLTSIVSYVALLKQCDIKNEDAIQYVNVLDEKADRLKKLIEDLVEASKASTGNIKVNYVSVNLQELAAQAIGENSDALDEQGIDVRINVADEPITVNADSQLTWRVIDNLFSNIKKYAMSNTRVYINVRRENNFGVFEMKNISRNPLNIPPEELTQRFVRGDEARGGEGSGLGLSIAKSLCELQGGIFDVEIDGDLFKVIIKMPIDRNHF